MIPSGKISQSIVDKNGFRPTTFTREHFYSRQRAGRAIINCYREGKLTFDHLLQMLAKFTQVHYVSKEENIRLARIQKIFPDHTWQEQYSMANIVLVDDIGPAPVWFDRTYIVLGNTYHNIKEVADATGLDYDTIRSRCKAGTNGIKKWADYKWIIKRKKV